MNINQLIKKRINASGMVYMRGYKWLLLIVIGMMLPLEASAQEAENIFTMQQKQLGIIEKSVSLDEALQQLEEDYDANIFYKSQEVEHKYVNKINQELSGIEIHLSLLLKPLDMTYRKLTETSFVVYQEEQPLDQSAIQQETISGTVTDVESGEMLPGVNVMVKGTTTGTSTDTNGGFELSVESLQDTLVFSFVGYQTQEVPIGGRTEIDIALESQAIAGEELVVVGYGTQQRSNLTGSVSSVDMGQIDKKTVTQSSQALVGAASGITVTQGSGQPGENQASIRIRGMGTFSGAGNSPLVLIDGIPGSIDDVNVNNIENISVLKDASSASIYGSRAANGVILVTTKQGEEGELQVTYESYIGKQEPTELPEFVDSWTYAKMINEARVNQGLSERFSQEDIQRFESGNYPDEYPNKQHVQDLFNSGNGFQQKHNLTFSGGTENTQYLFSTGYLMQNGLISETQFGRYDLRLNLNSDLRNNLNLDVKLFGNYSNQETPAMIYTDGGSVGGMYNILRSATSFNATIPGRRFDGSYGIKSQHPSAEAGLDQESFNRDRGSNFVGDASLSWNIFESLELKGNISYKNSFNKVKIFGARFMATPELTFGPSQAEVNYLNSQELRLESLIEYDEIFGSHHLNILGGTNQTTNNNEFMTGYRDQFPNNQIHELNAASSENQEVSGSSSTWKLRSFFGRVNYSFQEKYILEGNFRYDGSSRFSENNRYGLFHSISAAWRISEEDFFQVPWIQNLKIRGSYGTLGNQEIGNYPYHKTLITGNDYPIGGILQSGIQLVELPFENVSWETTRVIDGGMDIGLFEDKVNLTVDYYNKTTSNILYELTVSDVIGMETSPQNGGEVENRGWEFELGYNNTIGEFSFSINPNFSINHNSVLGLAGVSRDVDQGLFLGEPISSIYGYKTDGLFIDQEDIESYAGQNYDAKPGYPRYQDISGPDGVPDGRVTAEYDRTVIGNEFPKYSYGLGFTANYKGFDFYTQLQGLSGFQKLIGGLQLPFYNGGNIQQWHVDNRWTEENPNRNAKFTRLEETYSYPPWSSNLDYWMRDARFLRIKNIQLGYNISSKLLNNSFINQARVYISGENIKTFDRHSPGWDPEMETTGYRSSQYYPPTRLWSLGVSVQF